MKITIPVDITVLDRCGNVLTCAGRLIKGTEVNIYPPLIDCRYNHSEDVRQVVRIQLGGGQEGYVYVDDIHLAGLREKLKRLERFTVIEGGVTRKNNPDVQQMGIGVENIY